MILSVCLSPCIDVTMELDSLNIGKTNIVKNKSLTYTGKALNVAIGVSRLGADSYVTGFLYNENGSFFEHMLDREGVPFTFVWNNGRVRENYKFIDNKSMMTQVNTVGAPIEERKLYELSTLVQRISEQADVAVISGGLPEGVKPEYYETLFRMMKKSVKKVADVDGAKLFSVLNAGVDLIKPNLQELELALGRELKTNEDVFEGCNELLNRGASAVLVSLGRNGAVITDGTKRFFCKSINVAVNSTLGAGDAMVAAAATRLEQNADLEEILRAGVAAGTANVTTFGTTSFAREKFEEIYKTLNVVKL